MGALPSKQEFHAIAAGFDRSAGCSYALRAKGHTQDQRLQFGRAGVLAKSWQRACHLDKRPPRQSGYRQTKIALVKSVQRGMLTPVVTQERTVNGPDGSGKPEQAVHHFHGLVLDADKALA